VISVGQARAAGSGCWLLALEAVHLECQQDVGEAPEQREETDPDQQQQRPRGDSMLISVSLRTPASTVPPGSANDYGLPARGFTRTSSRAHGG
jgi:hypothetical protein